MKTPAFLKKPINSRRAHLLNSSTLLQTRGYLFAVGTLSLLLYSHSVTLGNPRSDPAISAKLPGPSGSVVHARTLRPTLFIDQSLAEIRTNLLSPPATFGYTPIPSAHQLPSVPHRRSRLHSAAFRTLAVSRPHLAIFIDLSRSSRHSGKALH